MSALFRLSIKAQQSRMLHILYQTCCIFYLKIWKENHKNYECTIPSIYQKTARESRMYLSSIIKLLHIFYQNIEGNSQVFHTRSQLVKFEADLRKRNYAPNKNIK